MPNTRPATKSEQQRRFEAIIRADPDLMRLLRAIRSIGLPQWRLVAGCLYQTVWNVLTGRARGRGIRDYDLIYFDEDLSWAAEDAMIRRVAVAARGCVGPVETRNQYASVVHAVGVRLGDDDRLDVAAPFGLDDVFAMVIRPNRALDNAASHGAKARRAQAIWPEVTVIPWDDATPVPIGQTVVSLLDAGGDRRDFPSAFASPNRRR